MFVNTEISIMIDTRYELPWWYIKLFINKNSSYKLVNMRLFVGMLVSFIVNICVSTGYLLTFIGASISACTYEKSSQFSIDLVIITCGFVILLALQAILLAAYLMQCTNLINKDLKKKTVLFDKFKNDSGQGINAATNERDRSRYVLVRYLSLHGISIGFMCIMPLFIISTSLPIMKNIINYSLQPLTGSEYILDNKYGIFVLCFYYYNRKYYYEGKNFKIFKLDNFFRNF